MPSKSLWNNEPQVVTGFNADGYTRFMADNFTIIDKHKQEVPFVQQEAQADLLFWMERYFQILILKARKLGFSSTALGVAATKFITGKNERCVTMSFDQSAADKQLARAKHFIASYERTNDIKIPLKYNSKSEIVYEGIDEHGRQFTNALRVGTAKSTSFGRGDDITFLHLTEVSLADDIPTLLAGVGEAVVDKSHIILETTANGYNSYKEFWDAAVLNERGFAALFYSPEWEYGQEYLDIRRKKLGRLFEQEYPMTPEQAFIASGATYFDKDALRQYLSKVMEPIHVATV